MSSYRQTLEQLHTQHRVLERINSQIATLSAKQTSQNGKQLHALQAKAEQLRTKIAAYEAALQETENSDVVQGVLRREFAKEGLVYENEHSSGVGIVENKLKTPGQTGEKAIPYSERGIEIEERLRGYLNSLKKNSDYISAPPGTFKMEDIAVLTTETGVEYTVLTISNRAYLVRGDDRGTTIPAHLLNRLIENGGTLDYHSHPYIGDLFPSKADRLLLEMLTWQDESIIIDPNQSASKFTPEGATEVFKVSRKISEEMWADIFKEVN